MLKKQLIKKLEKRMKETKNKYLIMRLAKLIAELKAGR